MASRSRHRLTSLAILLGLGVLGILAVPELRDLRLDNSLDRWLSKNNPTAIELAQFYEWFPHEERIVVSWAGCALDDSRLQKVATHLGGTQTEDGERLGGLRDVEAVDSPHDLLQRMERKVDEQESRRRLYGTLLGQGGRAALLVTLTPEATQNPRSAIRDIKQAVLACGIAEHDLYLGGEAVTADAIDEEVRLALWNSVDPLQRPPVFLLSALCGLVVAFLVLRSWRLGLMVLAVACLTAVITTAAIAASGQTMNMVLIVMPTLLVVLTLSAAIHLVNYWRHARREQQADPIRAAISQGWRPCVLAAATTLVGLLSLLISPLSPVRDFGIFSSIGVLLGVGIVLVSVPAALRLTTAEHRSKHSAGGLTAHVIWSWLGELLSKRKRMFVFVAALVFGGCVIGLRQVETDVRVIRYFPQDSRLARDSRFIETHIGGLSPVEVLIRFDDDTSKDLTILDRMEIVRSVEEKLRSRPEVSGTISLADFDTTYERPDKSASTFQKLRYHKRAHDTERRIKNSDISGTARYFNAPDVTANREWNRKDALNEVWRITAQTRLMDDHRQGTFCDSVDQLVAAAVQGVPGATHSVTGPMPLFQKAQRAMLTSLTESFGLAFAIIACTLSVMLRDVRAGVVAVLPCLMPVGVVFGLMAWNGMVFDIGTILTASVALGIAVDDTLHLLTWFRDGIESGSDRTTAVVNALKHCGPAMTQTTVVVSVSLLALYPAQLSLISQFGWVMAALLSVALIAELVLLPAFLLGSLGHWIETKLTRKRVQPSQPALRLPKATQSLITKEAI